MSALSVERAGGVTRVTLTRPPLNVLSIDTFARASATDQPRRAMQAFLERRRP